MLQAKEKLESYFHFVEKWTTATILIQLVFLIYLVAHYFGCFFRGLAYVL